MICMANTTLLFILHSGQLEQTLRLKHSELSKLQEHARGLEAEREATKKVLEQYKKECSSLVQEYESAAKDRDQLKQRLEESQHELTNKTDEVKQLKKHRDDLLDRNKHLDEQVASSAEVCVQGSVAFKEVQ